MHRARIGRPRAPETNTILLTTGLLFNALEHANANRAGPMSISRLTARIATNRRMAAAALDNIAGLTGRSKSASATEAAGDPHFDVQCAQLRTPSASPSSLPPQPDAGTIQCGNSPRPTGSAPELLHSTGEWWMHDNGPLVAQLHEGGAVALLRTGRAYVHLGPS